MVIRPALADDSVSGDYEFEFSKVCKGEKSKFKPMFESVEGRRELLQT